MKWIADFEAANSAEYSESGQRADSEQNTTEGIDHTHCPSIKPSVNRNSTKKQDQRIFSGSLLSSPPFLSAKSFLPCKDV